MKTVLGVGDHLDSVFSEAERHVVSTKKVHAGVAFSSTGPTSVVITAPATPESMAWDGWGTALKPAWEPILVGSKPT